jgi:hypothetical protein
VSSTNGVSDSTLGAKQFIDSYRPTLLLVVLLFAIFTTSTVWIDQLTGNGSYVDTSSMGAYVASQITDFGNLIRIDTQSTNS